MAKNQNWLFKIYDKNMKKFKFYWKFILTIFIISAVLNIAACFRSFCDWYTDTIYPVIADTFGKINNNIPFAIGEIIMYIGGIAIMIMVILLILLIFLRKKPKFKNFIKHYLKITLFIVTCFLFVYTTNWIIPLRTTPLYFGTDPEKKYNTEEVFKLRNYLIEEINNISETIERDENGYPVMGDIDQSIKEAMLSLSEEKEFSSIGNFVPDLKPAYCSDFLEWMNIGGFTYPFSMEMTSNRYCDFDKFYYPTLAMHELAHHFGFYRENEANFISYIAATKSDNLFLKYSAFYEVFWYIDNTYCQSIKEQFENVQDFFIYLNTIPSLDTQVYTDRDYFLVIAEEIYEEEVNEFLEQTISETVTEVGNTGWSTQKAILQEAYYDGVTDLMLRYYDGILY